MIEDRPEEPSAVGHEVGDHELTGVHEAPFDVRLHRGVGRADDDRSPHRALVVVVDREGACRGQQDGDGRLEHFCVRDSLAARIVRDERVVPRSPVCEQIVDVEAALVGARTEAVRDRDPKLTFEGATNFRPSWSPDGRSVLFSSNRDGVAQYDNDIYSKPAGAGADVVPDLVLDRPRGVVDAFWSPDGEWLVYRTTNIVEGAGDILAIRPGVDTVPVPLAATEFTEQSPTLSPDGRWLAYESNESGRFQIYVIPFPNIGDERRSPISTAGGRWPVWANSGRELFYLSLADELVAVDVQTTPTFARGAQDVLFSTSRFNLGSSVTAHPMYDISFDDQRFVMVQGDGTVTDEPEFILVQNFFEVVREQVGN